ncbi:MAG: Jag N-terminal domain-containing protein, partial [Oscillospiraceae bacterium]
MRNEAIATGRTVDAAIEAACAKLGLEREEVEIEVLDLPHKGGFLGFTNIPAK